MSRLQGKSAIILGAASAGNMAQVMARRFVDEGARVLVAGRKEEELRRFSAEIGGAYALCDITIRAEVDAMIAKAKDAFGCVDIAVNATGWGLLSPFVETTAEDLATMVALQFTGPFQFMQAVVAAMREGDGGSIIQISSATATIMLDNHAAYMGTKAGIDHVVRCVAYENGVHGIRANSISPGLTATPMTAAAMAAPGLEDAFIKEYPLQRIGTSEDIAAAAVFVASDECFMTGQNFQVNGGITLRRNPTGAEMMEAITAATQGAG